MHTFTTLLHREWMQHQRGWWLLGLVPLGLMLLAMLFGEVSLSGEESPAGSALVAMFVYVQGLLALAALAVLFQAPGLARRDQQDRSIEFWVSLPVGHSSAVGATLLAQLLLFPWMTLLLGLLGALVLAPLFVWKGFGTAALLSVPWASMAAPLAVGLLRMAVGVLFAVLWISPLLLLTMAASAWLKRWGMPVVAAVLGLGTLVAEKAYDITWPGEVLSLLFSRAGQALAPGLLDDGRAPDLLVDGRFAELAQWLVADMVHLLHQALSPALAAALVFSALCFALMVWRRSRT